LAEPSLLGRNSKTITLSPNLSIGVRRIDGERIVTVFGTLGFDASKFLPVVLKLADVRKVIVYHAPGETPTREKKVQRALETVISSLTASKVAVKLVKLKDPWTVSTMLQAFLEGLAEERPENSAFNLTGGTKTMTVAATLACLITGTRAYYVPEESDSPEPIELPLPSISVRSVLTPGQARALAALSQHDFDSMTELAKSLRLSSATVCHHVSRLAQMGAVSQSRGRDGRVVSTRLTEAGRILLLLHDTLRT